MSAAPTNPPSDDSRPGASEALPDDVRRALTQVAGRERVLVATDFDGVLAPLVLDPMASRPQEGTIDALRALATRPGVTVAVASGRDLATLRALTGLDDSDGVVLIGSHGGEASEALTSGSPAPNSGLTDVEQAALGGALEALETIAARFPQARIERKPAGVVLHTRGMAEAEAETAARAALAVPQDVPGVRAMRGKSVVELSVLDVSKGSALAALAARCAAEATVYFGDDVTDETVFSALDVAEAHVTIKVGEGETAAGYRIDACELMPAALDTLVLARRDATA